ncbi:MAG TPA: hypothetical protein PLY31_02530 [Tenuifilaceae bacterium]|mgnify:CR=1 FL=1|nr:hypothetical protein [Tenuifilaceae bacterium]
MTDTQLVEVGFIQRTHGVKGEIQISVASSAGVLPEELELVFLDIEGIPVPFFIQGIVAISDEILIVKFDEVDSVEEAAELVGLRVLLPCGCLSNDDGGVPFSSLVGYRLFSTKNEELGIITRYEEFAYNALFAVTAKSGKGLLIPAAENLISRIDDAERIVWMDIPQGLLEVNSMD